MGGNQVLEFLIVRDLDLVTIIILVVELKLRRDIFETTTNITADTVILYCIIVEFTLLGVFKFYHIFIINIIYFSKCLNLQIR
jgi:hypothetical protein